MKIQFLSDGFKKNTVQTKENMPHNFSLYLGCGPLFLSHYFTKLSSGSNSKLLIKTVRALKKKNQKALWKSVPVYSKMEEKKKEQKSVKFMEFFWRKILVVIYNQRFLFLY